MGFRAETAEDVYRYAMRLDRHGNRSLNDGFGFSIAFINDHSSVCREFLAEYFVDLCHRTADRIRFVFFGDVDLSVLNRVADELNRGGRSHRGEFLGGSSIGSATVHCHSTRPPLKHSRETAFLSRKSKS